MLVHEGLELLSEEDSRRLVATGEIGRIGITMGALPAIFPVNYRFVDGSIYFRSAPGSKVAAAAAGAVVAFEVDDYDARSRSGWSVLVVGPAELVHDGPTALRLADTDLRPYADGQRTTLVRIEPTFVSGRRITREV